MTLRVAISIQPHTLAPTRILSSFIPVDKAGDQHNECEESDGTHQADKPALSWYSFVDAGETWRDQTRVTLTYLGLFIRTLDWMFTTEQSPSDAAGGVRALRPNINIKQLILLV